VPTEAEPTADDAPPPSKLALLRRRADAAVATAGRQWDRSRARWPWLALPAEFVTRWTTTNGSILAGHLAYRVFVFVLPLVVLMVGVLGYVSATDASLLSSDGGLKFGSAIASTMTDTGEQARESRLQLVVFGGFAVLLAASGLVKALQLVFATAWGVSVKSGKSRFAVLGRFLPGVLLILAAVALRQWIGRSGVVFTIGIELANIAIDAVALLGLSWVLPRRTSRLVDLVPGALLGGVGLAGLHIAALIYFPARIERASALYGTLGVALVALLYLFLVGQVLVASAIANAVWVDRREIVRPPPPHLDPGT
jgi:membrane protein